MKYNDFISGLLRETKIYPCLDLQIWVRQTVTNVRDFPMEFVLPFL